MFKFQIELKNTHELKDGDFVQAHGCVFRLRDGQNCKKTGSVQYCDGGVSWFKTDLIAYNPVAMSRAWAETWTIQGNSRAHWSVISAAEAPLSA